jgi:hypothetical protein
VPPIVRFRSQVVIVATLFSSSFAGASDRAVDGGGDFTFELRLRGSLAANDAPAVSCGPGENWIHGNVLLDADRREQDARRWGLSLGAGRCAFGVTVDALDSVTLCGKTMVLDGEWHQVAVARRRSDGFLWLWVDGRLEASEDGPDGDLGPTPPGRGSEFPSFDGSIDGVRFWKGLLTAEPAGADDDIRGLPRGAVFEAHSNPALRQTILFARFPDDRAGRAAVTIHDGRGVERVELTGTILGGSAMIVWDGTDRTGARLPAGLYAATLVAGDVSRSIELRLP